MRRLGTSWGASWGVLGASWGRLGASWGVLEASVGRLGDAWLHLFKKKYKTAVKTHIIGQVSSYHRLKFVRNHLTMIKIVLKHQDVS